MHREVGILNIVNSRFRLNHGLLIFWNNLPVRYPPCWPLCLRKEISHWGVKPPLFLSVSHHGQMSNRWPCCCGRYERVGNRACAKRRLKQIPCSLIRRRVSSFQLRKKKETAGTQPPMTYYSSNVKSSNMNCSLSIFWRYGNARSTSARIAAWFRCFQAIARWTCLT